MDTILDGLDKLFFEHSAHYKSIDNGPISFFVWPGGAGGDFLINLFLDNLLEHDKLVKKFRSENKIQYLEKNRYFPYLDDNKGVYDVDTWLKKSANIDIIFEIEKLNFSKETIEEFDDVYYQAYLTTVGKNYIIQRPSILPYFYYKNFEKVKYGMITVELSLEEYVNELCEIKIGLEGDVFGCGTQVFESLPRNQLYKIDYRKLFFEQDVSTIQKLINFFNSKNSIEYYKYEIEQYHKRNLELVNQDS
jgi:hypothetical protein